MWPARLHHNDVQSMLHGMVSACRTGAILSQAVSEKSNEYRQLNMNAF